MYKSMYTFADGTNILFSNNDFDYIVNFDGRGFKHLAKFGRWSNRWFDGETKREVTDEILLRALKWECVDDNPNCYKNLTFPGYEFIPNVGRRNGKQDALNSYASYIIRNTPLYTPTIKKIIVNDKTTIVLWGDSTKTIVRPSANDNYDLEAAVCAAIAKKIYGTNSAFKRMIKEKTVVQENKKKEKKEKDPNVSPTKPRHTENNGFVSTKGEEDSVIYTGSKSLYNIDPNPATEGEEG